MIRTLTSISELSVIDQRASKNVTVFQKIVFDDSTEKKGGFGTVYSVNAIDDTPTGNKYLLKTIWVNDQPVTDDRAYETVQLLHTKVKRDQLKTSLPIYVSQPGLIGLPFAVFYGYDAITEKHCTGMLMYDLGYLGYKDAWAGGANVIELSASVSIMDKFHLGHQLFRTVEWLHEQNFIHSDLGVSAIFIDEKNSRLALIDFDGGFHYDEQDKPGTVGKLSYVLDHLWGRVLNTLNIQQDIRVIDRLQGEHFSIAAMFFEIIFGTTQYFFLESGESAKTEYAQNYVWPAVDFSNSIARADNEPAHTQMVTQLEQINHGELGKIVAAWKRVFGDGFIKGYERYSAGQWRKMVEVVLPAAQFQPTVLNFSPNKLKVHRQDETLTLTWVVKNADAVYIDDQLQNDTEGSFEVTPGGDRVYKLHALSYFGKTVEEVSIAAVLVEPAFRTLATSTDLRDNLDPIKLRWQADNCDFVTVAGVSGNLPAVHTLEVSPTDRVTYRVTAHGFFGQKVTEEIMVDVISPRIDHFSYEVNLEHGIRNVDLLFKVANVERVEILPQVGIVDADSGVAHVPISYPTEFKLTASGHFGSVSQVITAHPFPVPAVVELRMEQPILQLSTAISPAELKMPDFEHATLGIADIMPSFQPVELDIDRLRESLKPPDFLTANKLEVTKTPRAFSFSHLFDYISQKIKKTP
jgi:hypothetical protein